MTKTTKKELIKNPIKMTNALKTFLIKNTCFQVSGGILFCNFCGESKEYHPKHGVFSLKKHLLTKKHIESSKKESHQNRLQVETIADTEKFHINLTNALIAANIPINKLNNPIFKDFLEDISGKKLSLFLFIEPL